QHADAALGRERPAPRRIDLHARCHPMANDRLSNGSGLSRRSFLQIAGAVPLAAGGLLRPAGAAAPDTLTIAYNVNLPAFDPTVGASAVNPTIQALYQAIFDPYVAQEPNLKFKPGLITEWGWNEDKTKVHMTVREGATWHNG